MVERKVAAAAADVERELLLLLLLSNLIITISQKSIEKAALYCRFILLNLTQQKLVLGLELSLLCEDLTV